MKYIFLDIDGVIATEVSLIEQGKWGLVKSLQNKLGKIIAATGAKIVISSSWRLHTVEDTKQYFHSKGFDYVDDIIGVTVRAYHCLKRKDDDGNKIHLSIPRGVEIKQWLDTKVCSDNGQNFKGLRPGIDFSYVILDDDTDMLLGQKDYFLHCETEVGLTDDIVEQAIKILNQIDTVK